MQDASRCCSAEGKGQRVDSFASRVSPLGVVRPGQFCLRHENGDQSTDRGARERAFLRFPQCATEESSERRATSDVRRGRVHAQMLVQIHLRMNRVEMGFVVGYEI